MKGRVPRRKQILVIFMSSKRRTTAGKSSTEATNQIGLFRVQVVRNLIMTDLPQTTSSGCFGFERFGRNEKDNNINVDEVMLAREMNELTVAERNKVLDDIHGVASVQEETPEFVADSLERLNKDIAELPYTKRKDMDRAFFLKPGLHKDDAFKLMFLRADDFNSYEAAHRMARYFTNKLSLFGEEKLVKKISMDDLDEQDMKVLLSSGNIVLPYKDRAGRPIWFSDCSKADYDHTRSTMRSFWYLAMATLEEEEAQTKGISCVLYCPGVMLSNLPSISQVTSMLLQVGSVHSSLPCRITSFHFGTDEPKMQFFLQTLQKAFGKQVRLRLRSHFGSAIEMRYSLLTFGIHCEGLLPTVGGEDEKPAILKEFYERRLEIERCHEEQRLKDEARTEIIIFPENVDVLLGRGRPYQDFIGNRRFAELIDSQIERFQSCESQFEKTCVILDVVKQVKNNKGRFLKRNSMGWEVISDEVARKKAGTTFRTRAGLLTRNPPSSVPTNRATKRMKFDPDQITS